MGSQVTRLPGIQVLMGRLGVEGGAPTDTATEWIIAGANLQRQEQYREAIAAYQKALEIAPEEVAAHVGLASAYEEIEEYGQALVHTDEAARLAPHDADILRHLGRLQCLHGNLPECVAALEESVALDPEDADGHYLLAAAYHQSALHGFNESLKQYQEAIARDPQNGRAYVGLGLLYGQETGKEALAFETFQKALQVATETDDEVAALKARSELAALYYAQDNYTQCIEEWTQVLEATPDDPAAHRRLGLCYAMRDDQGDLEQAISELERSMVLSFGPIDAYYYYLGHLYARQEDYDHALWSWEQFLHFSQNPELNQEVQNWVELLQEER